MLLAGCGAFFEEDTLWIRENTPKQQAISTEQTVPTTTPAEETVEVPDHLQMDDGVAEGPSLCFTATPAMLSNDMGYYLQRQIPDWTVSPDAVAPYCQILARSQELDLDPVLKTDPTAYAYLSDEAQIYEVAIHLMTHDWTQPGEDSFQLFGKTLLQCFWPAVEAEEIAQTAAAIRRDMDDNKYTTSSAVPRPQKNYVHGNTAAYGYTHVTHISFNVLPVNEARLRELEEKGVQIIMIP